MARSSVPPTCPSCAAPLIEISLGTELVLRSCSNCDTRWWLRADGAASIEEVLGVVAASASRRRPIPSAC